MKKLEAFYLEVLHHLPALLFSHRWAEEGENVSYLNKWVQQLTKEKLQKMPFLRRVLVLALWPPISALSIVYLTATNGWAVRKRSGRGLWAQAGDQFRYSVTKGVPAPWYYIFELFRPENAANAGRYLLRYQLKSSAIYSRLRRYAGKGDNRLRDKLQFFDFCEENDLATARIFCVVHGADVIWRSQGEEQLPRRDIFAKPRHGRGGRGAERWVWKDGGFTNGKGQSFDPDGLLDYFKTRSKDTEYILQDRLINHADLSVLNSGALSTIRVLVFSDENWQPEVVHAYFRMSYNPDSVVDNVHAGGLATPVNIETGRLSKATNLGIPASVGWFDEHPVTEARINGYQVPHWHAVKELALRAHEKLGSVSLAGWDIAVLDEGPCLVEGNVAPCMDSTQRMLNLPLGNERYGNLIAFHLKRAVSGEQPPRPLDLAS